MTARILPRSFYDRPALQVARAMLGQVLVHEEGGQCLRARIVETEAYLGDRDLARHASGRRTPRTDPLFGPPGFAYVFRIYGMHHCFNAVTGREGLAAAVLVRGAEALEGFTPGARLDGPGRLCKALQISLHQNRASLVDGGALRIEEGPAVSSRAVSRGPRVGVEYAREWALKPYRLWVRGSPGFSGGA